MEIKLHPVCEIFPLMGDDEFQQLKADIEKHGQRESITYWNGLLVDGRHRLRACQELHIEPMAVELEPNDDPVAFALSCNLHRRHLDESQRGMVAAALSTLKHGGDRKSEEIKGPIGTLNNSIDEASDKLKVSPRTTKRARNVIKNGCKELQQLVHVGKLSVSKAEEIANGVKCPKEQVALATEYIESPKKKPAPKQKPSGTVEVSDAMKFVENAISQLSRIRSDDPERQEAFNRVRDWIDKQ
jgi:ParB-like chromosome segregation protein Spo0J